MDRAEVWTLAALAGLTWSAILVASLLKRAPEAEPPPPPPPPPRRLQIALAAGHHNTSGGNPLEYSLTGPICRAIADEGRRRGHDVRVITPDDGLGDFPGTVADVAAQVVAWDQAGWTADVFLETHTDALWKIENDGRGVFVIYPDWGSDTDTNVRDRLGPDLARRVAAATGLGVWADGTMSERSTGVGLSGYRLAVFAVTQPLRLRCTRLLVEYGAHGEPRDLAILQSPGFNEAAAVATVDALVT